MNCYRLNRWGREKTLPRQQILPAACRAEKRQKAQLPFLMFRRSFASETFGICRGTVRRFLYGTIWVGFCVTTKRKAHPLETYEPIFLILQPRLSSPDRSVLARNLLRVLAAMTSGHGSEFVMPGICSALPGEMGLVSFCPLLALSWF